MTRHVAARPAVRACVAMMARGSVTIGPVARQAHVECVSMITSTGVADQVQRLGLHIHDRASATCSQARQRHGERKRHKNCEGAAHVDNVAAGAASHVLIIEAIDPADKPCTPRSLNAGRDDPCTARRAFVCVGGLGAARARHGELAADLDVLLNYFVPNGVRRELQLGNMHLVAPDPILALGQLLVIRAGAGAHSVSLGTQYEPADHGGRGNQCSSCANDYVSFLHVCPPPSSNHIAWALISITCQTSPVPLA